MTQHTDRDMVWDTAIRIAMTQESFCIEDVVETDPVEVNKRIVRDTMRTMADLNWLRKQNPNGEQWQRGPVLTGEKDPMEKYQSKDGIPVDQFNHFSELDEGEVYVGTVDKASSNALIWLTEPGGQHINLGPIDQSVVGEEVRFRYIQTVWGRCLDEEYIYDGYDPKSDGSGSKKSKSEESRSEFLKTAAASSSNSSDDPRKCVLTPDDDESDNKNKLLKGKL